MDIQVTVTDAQRNFIQKASASIAGYRGALIERFPEREGAVKQLLICLLTGSNMIIFGPPGSAKTMMVNVALSNIIGSGENNIPLKRFAIQLDSETTVDKLIGPPIIALFEKGVYQPNVDGYLPTAHFAILDEIFDSPSVLRSCLDILNEHQLVEGHFNYNCPLMSGFGTTNRSPEQIMSLYPHLDLAAVVDRFLCVSQVNDLDQNESQYSVISSFVMGANDGPLSSQVKFIDLQRLVGILKSTNQFPSNDYGRIYQSLTDALNKAFISKFEKPINGRRKNWMTQVVEAGAILNGRVELYFDDLYHIKLCLCPSDESPEGKLFDQIAGPIIEKAKKDYNERKDEAIVLQLDDLETRLKKFKKRVKLPSWSPDSAELGQTIVELAQIENALKGVRPELESNIQRTQALMGEAQQIKTNAVQKAG